MHIQDFLNSLKIKQIEINNIIYDNRGNKLKLNITDRNKNLIMLNFYDVYVLTDIDMFMLDKFKVESFQTKEFSDNQMIIELILIKSDEIYPLAFVANKLKYIIKK